MDSGKIEEQISRLAALQSDGMYQDDFLLTGTAATMRSLRSLKLLKSFKR